MATFSGGRVIYGLNASGTPIGTGVSGTVEIGTSGTSLSLSTADIIYSVRCILASATDVFTIDLTDNDTSGSDAWTAGTAQVETATAAGTITGSGDAEVIVTASGMTGSPKTISVAVLVDDTASDWAEKVRTALAADTDVAAIFDVSGSTTSIVLTRKATNTYTVPGGTLSIYAANDATLNISLDNDTCTGITTAATSANTTAGVASNGAKIYDGDGNDFEGEAVTAIDNEGVLGLMISVAAGNSTMTTTSGIWDITALAAGETFMRFVDTSTGVGQDPEVVTATCGSGPCDLTITVIGDTSV